MNKVRFWGLITVVIGLVLAGCAPARSPAPVPAPAPAPEAAPATPSLSPEEAAWAKVIAEAKREGRVSVYASAFVADVGKRLAHDFEKRFGIRVEILGVSGSMALEKVKVERSMKRPIADVMQSSIGSVTQLVKGGLAVGIVKELPAIRDKSVFLFDPVFSPGGDSITYAHSFFGIVVNTNLVKPKDYPQSYYDLLEPRWKGGKLALSDPRTTGGGLPFFYTPRYHKILDLDYYRRIAQQEPVILGIAGREIYRMIARGELPVRPDASDIAVAPVLKEGAPLKLLSAKEGTVAGGEIIALVKDAPHPNAGKLFINWLVSPEGQVAYHEAVGSTPFRKDVPDFLIPEARIKPTKTAWRTWEAEEWTYEDLKAGTMKQIFGEK